MENQNISDILNLIVTLQKNVLCDEKCQEGCTRPFLGPEANTVCYNTRPVSLFTCCTGTNWEFPYENNGVIGSSSVFRVENVEGNCATFRVLIPSTTDEQVSYALSNSYFTIDLSCVLALQCHPDILVN